MAKNMSKEEAYNFIDSNLAGPIFVLSERTGSPTNYHWLFPTKTPSTWVVEMQLKKLRI